MVLHPMTFDEFMVATGNTLMLEGIREAYPEKRAYQLHDQAMGFYRTYLLVGGMPRPAEESRLVRTGQHTRPQETALPVGQKPPAHVLQLLAESQHLPCW